MVVDLSKFQDKIHSAKMWRQIHLPDHVTITVDLHVYETIDIQDWRSWWDYVGLFFSFCLLRFAIVRGGCRTSTAGGTSDQWSRRLHWGVKRRKGEGGEGSPPPAGGDPGGLPRKFFWEIASKWCILSAFWGNQYTFFALKIYMKKMRITKFTYRLFIFFLQNFEKFTSKWCILSTY